MDPRDSALQQNFPTSIIPRFGPYEPAEGSGERLLIARNGVFHEIRRPWGIFVRRAGSIDVQVPYGELNESTKILMPKLPRDQIRVFIDEAARQYEKEIGASILWNENTKLFRLSFHRSLSSSGSHLDYEREAPLPGEHLVLDCHSHAHHPAFFSSTDDADDKWEVKLSLVVGECHQPHPTIAVRLCLKGRFESFKLSMP